MSKSHQLLKRVWSPSKISKRHYPYPTHFQHLLQTQSPKTEYSKLSNGLTIATEERPEMSHACIGIYIDAGSRYESDFDNGITHFFEHIAFKGTQARSQEQLEDAMESIGANFKCFTTREMSCFYAQTLREHTPLALDLLCDCVFNNSFNECEIDKQKGIVYAEMMEHDADTNALLYDYLHSSAFQGTPLGRTVMGPSENLFNFNACTVYNQMTKYFDPTKTVVAAVGGISHQLIVDLVNCYLSHLRSVKCVPHDPYRYTGSDLRYRNDEMPVANVIMAVEGPSWTHDDYVVMEIARHSMGAWDRSQLSGDLLAGGVAQTVSKMHYCDSYRSFSITYKDTGLWGSQFISDVMSLDYMSNMIQTGWMYHSLCMTEAEVERAKRFMKTKLLSDWQSATRICHELGRWMLYVGCCPSLLERITTIDKVHAEDVREVCSRYLYDKCPVVVAIGRTEGLMDYQRLRSGMYWLRY